MCLLMGNWWNNIIYQNCCIQFYHSRIQQFYFLLILFLKILLASPKITSFKVQIFIISLFKDLLFIGKLQQMICFVKFVIPGIQKVFFPLWFTVVAVSHHQIPVYIFFYHILGRIKGVLALSNVLNDRSAYSGLFFYFLRAVSLYSSPASTVPLGRTQPSYLFL